MIQQVPQAPIEQALARVGALWAPRTAPHQLILAQIRAGKTTLIKRLVSLRPGARVLILDPKLAHDEAWDDDPGGEHTWGKPVTEIGPGFGSEAEGGGPFGYWFRLIATPDLDATEHAFTRALQVVQTEGHVILVIDDAKDVCRNHDMRELVGSVIRLGGSNAISAIVATQELSYIPRSQAAFKWVGHTGNLEAAAAAVKLLGRRGIGWQDAIAAIPQYQWCYYDDQPGNPGPVLVT